MSLANPPSKRITAEDLMAMPDDGIDRWIVNGLLIERPGEFSGPDFQGRPMTVRNRVHSKIEARIATILNNWLDTQPGPRGEVVSGEVGFRLRHDPETTVGIAVAVASAEVVAATDLKSAFYDGPPVLAVEILSPSDRIGEVMDKVELYLEAGCVVWVVEPRFRTVSVYRRGRATETFNETQELSGEPELPGFRLPVSEIFS